MVCKQSIILHMNAHSGQDKSDKYDKNLKGSKVGKICQEMLFRILSNIL